MPIHRALLALIVAGALLLVSSIAMAHPNSPAVPCGHTFTAKEGLNLSRAVWDPNRWRRGAPKPAAIAAHRRQVRCAAGPHHRAAIVHSWSAARSSYFRHRRRQLVCARAPTIEGRVSYFGGGLMASGHFTSEPGIALNISPGSEVGWNNSTTRTWLLKLQRFRVSIAGHTAVLRVLDLGPAGFTGRAIDVTEGGVAALGLSGAFPTDAWGKAKLLRPGCT